MLIGLVGVERQSAVGPVLVTCTVAKAVGQLDPTSASPINFSVVFSAPVAGFDGLAINFAGSTAGGLLSATVSGSGTTYNVAVTGMTTSGDVAITVVSGYTTPPNSISTSADNTVAWLGAAGGWETLYTQPLVLSSDGWGSYTLRQVISTSAYGAGVSATASAIRVTIDASGTSGFVADHVRVGHAAASGDAYDYDGTQVPLLLSGSTSWTVAQGWQALSDSATYSFNKTKDLVFSIHFPTGSTSGVEASDPGVGYTGYYKNTGDVDDTVTTDATGYTATVGRLYGLSRVEVFVSTGPTLQALFGTGYTETEAFGAHTVALAATQTLTATRYSETDAFAAHTVSTTGATQTLTATRYTGDDAFPAHTVSPGAVGLSATRYTGDDAFPTNVVAPGAVALSAARYTGDDAFAAATVTLASGAVWSTLFTNSLSADSNGWQHYCMAQYIAPAAYAGGAPATGTKIRITIRTASTVGVGWNIAYVGHVATSGDVIDFDGTQILTLWSGSGAGTVGAATSQTCDDMTYAFDKTKGLVFRMTFDAASNMATLGGTGSNYKKSYSADGSHNLAGVTDVATTASAGSWDPPTDGIYLVEKIEVFG